MAALADLAAKVRSLEVARASQFESLGPASSSDTRSGNPNVAPLENDAAASLDIVVHNNIFVYNTIIYLYII